MTLQQAYRVWSQNSPLDDVHNNIVNRVLMRKYYDIHLESISEFFVRRIFWNSKESRDVKVNAASVLVSVLKMGAKNGDCNMPTFDFTIASERECAEENEIKSIKYTESPIIVKKKSKKRLLNN